jgi:hypothetical protein
MSPTLSSCYDASSGPWSIVGEGTDAMWGFALLWAGFSGESLSGRFRPLAVQLPIGE